MEGQESERVLPVWELSDADEVSVWAFLRHARVYYPAPSAEDGLLGLVDWFACADDESVCVAGFEEGAGGSRIRVLQAYDAGGRFLYRLASDGEGPGSFAHPSDMHIRGDTLFVWDRIRQEVFCYSLADGRFLTKYPLGLSGWHLFPLDRGWAVGRGHAVQHDAQLPGFRWEVILLSRSGAPQMDKRGVWIEEAFRDRYFHFGGFMPLHKGARALYLAMGKDTVFLVDAAGVRPQFVLRPEGYARARAKLDEIGELARKSQGPDPRRDMELLGWVSNTSHFVGFDCAIRGHGEEEWLLSWARGPRRAFVRIADGEVKGAKQWRESSMSPTIFQAHPQAMALYIAHPAEWRARFAGKELPAELEALLARLSSEQDPNPVFLFFDNQALQKWLDE